MLALAGVLAIVLGLAQIRLGIRSAQVVTSGGRGAVVRSFHRGHLVQGAFAVMSGLFFIAVWYSI